MLNWLPDVPSTVSLKEKRLSQIEIDDLDRAIIKHLQRDGRRPFTDIAADVDVSEATVRRRVKDLLDKGVLQIVGVVEPWMVGWNAAGFIGVSTEPGAVESVAERISQLPEVTYLFMASGEFDLFVEAYCEKMDGFITFLNQKLRQIPGVQRTQTFMILKMYKLSYEWGEAEVRSGSTSTRS